MKVKDLVCFLKTQNQEATVLLSSDDDGNWYSPVDNYSCGNFDEEKSLRYSKCDYMSGISDDEMHGDFVILYPR